jgi:hypothetical protein
MRNRTPFLGPAVIWGVAALALTCRSSPELSPSAPPPSVAPRLEAAAASGAEATQPPSAAESKRPSVPRDDSSETPSGHSNPSRPAQPASGKVSAPALVGLSVSRAVGDSVVVLRVQVTAAVPRVVARFVLPPAVRLVEGALEQDLGAMSSGQQREIRISVAIPAEGRFVIAAGADLHIASGIKLHKGDVISVGSSR